MVAAPSYGVDDVAHLFHEMPAGVQRIQAQLEETIRNFEPRLTRVSVVRLEPGELALTLRFEIRASLITGDHVVPIRFAAAIDPVRRSISA
jgi:type VI secretion system lysozyme-like protein